MDGDDEPEVEFDGGEELDEELGEELGEEMDEEFGEEIGEEMDEEFGEEIGEEMGEELDDDLDDEFGEDFGDDHHDDFHHDYDDDGIGDEMAEEFGEEMGEELAEELFDDDDIDDIDDLDDIDDIDELEELHDEEEYETTVSANWWQLIAGGLAGWVVALLLTGVAPPDSPFGYAVAFLGLGSWVGMGIAMYYDIRYVRANSDWVPSTVVWVVAAVTPLLNLVAGAVYLFRRRNVLGTP
jgi:hypothetical protein